jgi:predicted nucleic acid-binding protein
LFVVDSNHWWFYLDQDTPEHASVAPRLDALLETEELLQSTIIQLEVIHAAYRRWGRATAAPLGLFLGMGGRVLPFGPDDLEGAMRILDAHAGKGIGGRDAAILHAAVKHDASLLCTGDKALGRAARKLGLEVRDLTR